MYIMRKTPKGTISASNHFDNGICAGIYGKRTCISIEYNPKTEQLELLLMDKELFKQGFVIKHVDSDWNEI